MRLFDLEKWSLEDFQSEFFKENLETDDDEAYDLLCEIANSRVPIYTSDILEVALNDLRLAYDTPEYLGSNCKASPISMIQSNIYEHLISKLSEWYYKNKND